jgi:UDP-GlcNAc:undecaprenyl-phosphate GlcNAc-1-phosphate transferase
MPVFGMDVILGFFLALFLSILAVPMLMRVSSRWRLVDAPDARKSHTGIVPRVGGIGIALSVAIPAALMATHNLAVMGFLIGAITIVVFGILDDRYDLDYRMKLLGQGLAAVSLVASGICLHHLPLFGMDAVPDVIAYPLTVIFILAATNAFNLLDGLDGLAGGCAILSLAAIALLAATVDGGGQVVLIAVVVIGGLFGFLRYNTHPAIVFMGDAGSQFLGFSIAALSIMLIEGTQSALSPAIMLPLLGLPILDTAMVMLVRIRLGRSPFSPDRNHIHHKLLSLGLKHHEAVGLIYAVQAAIVSTAYFLRFESDLMILATYAGLCAACVVAYLLARRHIPAVNLPASTGAAAKRADGGVWRERIGAGALRYIEWSAAGYLIIGAAAARTTPPDISVLALVLAAAVLAIAFFAKPFTLAATRLTAYLAVIYVSYLSVTSPQFNWLTSTEFSAWLVSVVFAIAVAIMLMPREQFQLSTLDLLIVLVVIGSLSIPIPGLDQQVVARVVFRSLVFLYACEVLLTLKSSRFGPVGMAATISLVLLGSHLVTGWF